MNRNIRPMLLMSVVLFLALSLTSAVATAATTTPESPDPSAMKLLSAVEAKLARLKSVSAEVTTIYDYPPTATWPKPREIRNYSTYRLTRPSYLRFDDYIQDRSKAGLWTNGTHSMIFANDGKKEWRWFDYGNTYDVKSADPAGKTAQVDSIALGGFFDSTGSLAATVRKSILDGSLIWLKDDGVSVWNGSQYRVVSMSQVETYFANTNTAKTAPGGKVTTETKFYIGADDLVHRIATLYNIGWRNEEIVQYSSLNQPSPRSSFAFTLPAGAHLPQPPPPLLANGTMAPDFKVEDSSGKDVHLSDFAGKVVVVDFWATWCGPCQESLPHTNEVAKKLKDLGVVFLGVNTWDTKDAFQQWLPVHKQFDAINFVIDTSAQGKDIASTLYKVSGIPTQFVIDTSGKIAASYVGYGGPTDDLENSIRTALSASPPAASTSAPAP